MRDSSPPQLSWSRQQRNDHLSDRLRHLCKEYSSHAIYWYNIDSLMQNALTCLDSQARTNIYPKSNTQPQVQPALDQGFFTSNPVSEFKKQTLSTIYPTYKTLCLAAPCGPSGSLRSGSPTTSSRAHLASALKPNICQKL